MHSLRSVRLVAALAFCGAAGFAAATGALPALAGAFGHTAKSTVDVTAGSPSEQSVKLSKTSFIVAGSVQFEVLNKGKLGHAFRICSAPRTTDAASACVGKATPVIKPGKSAMLNVTLAKGSYEYLATTAGQSGSVKGLIGVGQKPGAAAPSSSPSPSPAPGTVPVTTTTMSPQPATSTTCNVDGTVIPC